MQQSDAIGISRNQPVRTSDSAMDAQPAGNAIPRIDTHWSRIFYYDLFAADSADDTRSPGDPESKETFVASGPAGRDFAPRYMKSPVQAALILLAVFIAMYLAVAGVIYVLASPDAAAITTEGLMAPAVVPSLDVARRNGRAVINGNRQR